MEFPATTWEGVAYVHTMGGVAARDLDAQRPGALEARRRLAHRVVAGHRPRARRLVVDLDAARLRHGALARDREAALALLHRSDRAFAGDPGRSGVLRRDERERLRARPRHAQAALGLPRRREDHVEPGARRQPALLRRLRGPRVRPRLAERPCRLARQRGRPGLRDGRGRGRTRLRSFGLLRALRALCEEPAAFSGASRWALRLLVARRLSADGSTSATTTGSSTRCRPVSGHVLWTRGAGGRVSGAVAGRRRSRLRREPRAAA